MGSKCLLKTCQLLQELHQEDSVRHSALIEEYIRAGILERNGNRVTVKDRVAFKNMVEGQCAGLLQNKAEAENLLQNVGLNISITSMPQEALLLIKNLNAQASIPERALHQQLSAELRYLTNREDDMARKGKLAAEDNPVNQLFLKKQFTNSDIL